jgi:dihydrodiol dehydrogenase / D-xylose 1-dehydrogenase (NADP)
MKKKGPLPPAPSFIPRDVSLGLTRAEDVAFPLRWGIMGTGEISRCFVRSSRECAGATMAAVASRTTGNAGAFADAHGVEKAYDSYQDMVASPEVDIVYVGTPDTVHKEHCLMAIEAGKHVLCEKALAKNVADAREMYAAAERNNVMLQDGVWTRFFPAVEHARSLIEAGAIGDVVMVQADFDALYTTQAVTLAYGVNAKPINIQASGMRPGPGGAILEFENNRFAVLTFIAFRSEFPEVTEITGTRGRITLEQPAHCPTALTVRVPPAAPSRYMGGNTPSPLQRFEYPLPDSISLPGGSPNQQGFYYMTEAIHRCRAAGLRQCPQFDRAESLHLLDILGSINSLRAKNPEMDI